MNIIDISSPAYPILAIAVVEALGLLCLWVVLTDFRWRTISNDICAAIALLAIPYWFGVGGLAGLGGLFWHLPWLLLLFLPLCVLFAYGIAGGGDVKLLLALALWTRTGRLAALVVAVPLAGGVLAMGCIVFYRVARGTKVASLPYGAAIVAGAFWALLPDLERLFAAET